MIRHFIFGLAALFALLPWNAAAQDVTVRASVDGTVVGVGERLTYTITVEGASLGRVQRPEAPATSNLALVQSTPSTQQSTTIVNGRMQQSVGFRWSYRPVRVGPARIEGATVEVGGERFRTEPIAVDVVAQAQRSRRTAPSSPFGSPSRTDAEEPAVSDDDLFIRAVPERAAAYLNEPVPVTYHLYFRDGVQLRQSRLADSWDAEGFWREDLDVDARPLPRTEVIDGRHYRTIVLKRAVVFPTRPGTLTIDPLRIETEVYVPSRSRDPFDRLFSLGRDFRPVELSSPPVTVEARPLPDGAPDVFRGAVGDFELDVTASRRQLAVGEALDLRVRVRGTGNIATLEAPPLEVPGTLESYDPQVETDIERAGRRIRGAKTFTYPLVARSNGTFELPSVRLAYFDPGTETYRMLSSEPITLEITGTAARAPAASATTDGLPVDDVAPLRTTATRWHRLDATPLHRNPWAYAALLLPWLAVAGVLAWRRRADHLAAHPELVRRRRAHPEARRRLKEARSLLDGDARAFHAAVERALVGFVGDRLDVAAHALTRDRLDALLARAGADEATRRELTALLEVCDRGRFAPTASARAERETALARAQDLIAALDEALRAPKVVRVAPLMLLLLLLPAVAAAQPERAARALALGNERYAAGDYRGAVDAYEQALEAGYASGALYLNMGTAYYRLDEWGQAVRFYERARRLLPDDPAPAHDLALVRERLPDRFTPVPEPAPQRAWERVVSYGPSVWFWPGLLLYALGIGLLVHRIATRTRGAWHRRALVASLFTGLVLLALAFSVSLAPTLDRQAVVVAGEAPLREQPLAGSASELSVHEGTLVDVLGADAGWLRVRLPNGVTGYLAADAAAEV